MAFEDYPKPVVKRVPLGRTRHRLSFEKRLRLWLYLLGVPALALCMFLLLEHDATWPSVVICVIAIMCAWALAASLLTEQIVRPMQTLANVVAALREDDRGRLTRVAAAECASAEDADRPLGCKAVLLPSARRAAHAADALGRKQGLARGGAIGVGAADSCARTRDQQFPDAHQVDRRQLAREARGDRSLRRPGTRPCGHRKSRRVAEPFPTGVPPVDGTSCSEATARFSGSARRPRCASRSSFACNGGRIARRHGVCGC